MRNDEKQENIYKMQTLAFSHEIWHGLGFDFETFLGKISS
jgi:hypothetical protein